MDKSIAADVEVIGSNPRFISSASTVIVKFVAPAFIVAAGAVFEFCTWRAVNGDRQLWALFRGQASSALPTSDKLIVIPIIASFIFVFWLLHYSRVKRIRVEGQSLYISNYLKEIAVPLANVSVVKQNRWDSRLADIQFHSATPFGGKVTFYLPIRFWEEWYADINPALVSLRKSTAEASGTSA